MTKTKKTLEQIIEQEKAKRYEGGNYGIDVCKDHILNVEIELFGKSLYTLLEEYVEEANTDIFFNKMMVLACWELINEQ